MSDTNSPGLPGAGDPGDTSWPEYLTSGESHGTGAGETEGRAIPHRVIGTPPPVASRTMLAGQGDGGAEPVVRELPADPDNPAQAKKGREGHRRLLRAGDAGRIRLPGRLLDHRGRVPHRGPALQPGSRRPAVHRVPAPRHRRHALGPAPDAGRRAHRAAASDGLHAGGEGGVQGDLHRGRRGESVRQAPDHPAHPHRARRSRSQSRRCSCCGTSARCPARAWTPRSGARACG